MSLNVQKYLIPLLKSALNGTINSFEINQLVKIANQIAIVRLSQLVSSRKIAFDIHSHSISTIALDCIAETFERDEEGYFTELIVYFEGDRDPRQVSEEQTLINFRTLIFSKLKDGIFRIYREFDPVTSKILRNIKLIVKNTEEIYTVERFGETYLTIAAVERNEHLSEYPIEELEAELISRLHRIENIKAVLVCLLQILNECIEYRKYYSMIDCALIIKDVFLKLEISASNSFETDSYMITYDMKRLVEKSMMEIRSEFDKKYLLSKKVDEKTYNRYLRAINEYIYNTFVLNDGVEFSLYDYLKKHQPNLEHEDYRKVHRIKLEYMAKLSKKVIVENLKNAFE